MSIEAILDNLRTQCSLHGEFVLGEEESINDVVRRENVATGYGVYVISKYQGGQREVVYIGKAGTLTQAGEFKKQDIAKRLTMKQDGEYRATFFSRFIRETGIGELHFEWFVTFDDSMKIPPFLVEAELLAAFFEKYRKLPALNKSA